MSRSPPKMRSPSGSNSAKASLLSSVKREQVNGSDPLDLLFANPGDDGLPEEEAPRIVPVEVKDPVELQALSFLRNCRTPPLSAIETPLTLEGLRVLAYNKLWKSAAYLSAKLLEEQQQQLPQRAVVNSLLRIRFEALYRMKLYDDLSAEISAVLTRKEAEWQHSAEKRDLGNGEVDGDGAGVGNIEDAEMVAALKVLLIEVKIMTGRGAEALSQLSLLQQWLTGSSGMQGALLMYWAWQVRCHTVNAALRLRHWKRALQELKDMARDIASASVTARAAHSSSTTSTFSSTTSPTPLLPTPSATATGAMSALPSGEEAAEGGVPPLPPAGGGGGTGACAHYTQALVAVCLRLAAVLLQIGDLRSSASYVERASREFASEPSLDTSSARSIQSWLLLHQGMLLFSRNQYEEATDIFLTVVESQGQAEGAAPFSDSLQRTIRSPFHALFSTFASFSTSFSSSTSQSQSRQSTREGGEAWREQQTSAAVAATGASTSADNASAVALATGSVLLDSTVFAAAMNNLAICCLYSKQIARAIGRLEALILLDPAAFLSDAVVFNLCTLYDLSFAPDVSVAKKKVLQRVAQKYFLDDPILHWRSFRLS